MMDTPRTTRPLMADLPRIVRRWNFDASPAEARAQWRAAGYSAEDVAEELRSQGFSFWDIGACCGLEHLTDGQRLVVEATKALKGTKAESFLYDLCWRRDPESCARALMIAKALAAWGAAS